MIRFVPHHKVFSGTALQPPILPPKPRPSLCSLPQYIPFSPASEKSSGITVPSTSRHPLVLSPKPRPSLCPFAPCVPSTPYRPATAASSDVRFFLSVPRGGPALWFRYQWKRRKIPMVGLYISEATRFGRIFVLFVRLAAVVIGVIIVLSLVAIVYLSIYFCLFLL